jgi:tRNA(Ile)-lysidine synthetase-like protein
MMKVDIKPGKYILAVSGGVDSMVLLDMLSNLAGVDLVIAHFNHGIRQDSAEDETLVRHAAARYGLPVEVGYGRLGLDASEETARDARYDFLREVQARHKASKIITAHHQDDLIETALINTIRGTGRSGLSSISNNNNILRPLLNTPKAEIVKYAKRHKLAWRDDPTNQNPDYLRNHLRLNVLPKMDAGQRARLLAYIKDAAKANAEIDNRLMVLAEYVGAGQIDRQLFAALPSSVGNELLVYLLRKENVRDFDTKTINRLNLAIRTSKPASTHPIKKDARLEVGLKKAVIVTS